MSALTVSILSTALIDVMIDHEMIRRFAATDFALPHLTNATKLQQTLMTASR